MPERIKNNPLLLSALLIVASELMFASMAATIKIASVALPIEVIVFFRNLIVIILLLPWVFYYGFSLLSTEKLYLHFIRALAGLGAMYCFFYTVANMPLAEAALLKMTLPFFLPIIAWLWLDERVSGLIRLAIGVGFIGVGVILQPSLDHFNYIALFALLGSALAALAKVGIRKMASTEPSTRIVFYFSTISAVLAALPLLWAWHTPDWHGWILLGMLGLFGTLGQLLMTKAYGLAPSGQLGGFTYVAVLFSSLYGWLLWDDVLNYWFFIGAGFICCAGLIIMFEHQRSHRQSRVVSEVVAEKFV
jgi:drug/metabolite transporter (DMT)-like permease